MISITKFFRFEAAHYLPDYDGKCSNLHGHSYVLEVEVQGEVDERSEFALDGMVMDFGGLKKKVNSEVIDRLDHSDLNKIFKNPTAEIMVYWIVRRLKDEMPLPAFVDLARVRLWETVDSYAEWRKP